ncbi:hypothetical protein TWF481_006525 [Arthrobotrys musiformis]|uniref:F-box domain-containing protein n=1 Tax=Arthrobotrys musiformis TaxID=47236 RepID=A0AAV9W8S1_9PEZI
MPPSDGMSSTSIRQLPLELQAQVISYLPADDQIRAAEVCQSWCDILSSSQSMRRSRYSSERVAGVHSLISTQSQGFRCEVRSVTSREYYFQEMPLGSDNPFLDEPFFLPTAWNGEDPELATSINRMAFNLFTGFPGAPCPTWRGPEHWGRGVTVRQFIEAILKPVFDAARAGGTMEGYLTFFLGIDSISGAYKRVYARQAKRV